MQSNTKLKDILKRCFQLDDEGVEAVLILIQDNILKLEDLPRMFTNYEEASKDSSIDFIDIPYELYDNPHFTSCYYEFDEDCVYELECDGLTWELFKKCVLDNYVFTPKQWSVIEELYYFEYFDIEMLNDMFDIEGFVSDYYSDDAYEGYKEAREYAADPLGYYGLSWRDFFI
jgi:hypothetical protein